MELIYHRQVTERAIQDRVSARALAAILRGNFEQDSLPNLLSHPEYHYDDSAFEAGDRRLDALRAAAASTGDARAMWAAFGGLTHTAQDFYSHSNYVQLWIAARGGYEQVSATAIEPLDESILRHPELHSGEFVLLRDFIYHLPGQSIVRRLFKPHPRSHTAMNLDVPDTGPAFPYSLVAAEKRTRHEFEKTVTAIRAQGGEARVMAFIDR